MPAQRCSVDDHLRVATRTDHQQSHVRSLVSVSVWIERCHARMPLCATRSRAEAHYAPSSRAPSHPGPPSGDRRTSTSIASARPIDTALRPLTCAQPVIPGRTSWRRACSALYRVEVLGQQRARADQAHVPASTLMSSGSSSSDVARSVEPNGRGASASVATASTAPRRVGGAPSCGTCISVKSRPSLPGRSCLKSTGEPSLSARARRHDQNRAEQHEKQRGGHDVDHPLHGVIHRDASASRYSSS